MIKKPIKRQPVKVKSSERFFVEMSLDDQTAFKARMPELKAFARIKHGPESDLLLALERLESNLENGSAALIQEQAK